MAMDLDHHQQHHSSTGSADDLHPDGHSNISGNGRHDNDSDSRSGGSSSSSKAGGLDDEALLGICGVRCLQHVRIRPETDTPSTRAGSPRTQERTGRQGSRVDQRQSEKRQNAIAAAPFALERGSRCRPRDIETRYGEGGDRRRDAPRKKRGQASTAIHSLVTPRPPADAPFEADA